MKHKIKLFDPVFGISEENIVKKTLRSHFWASGSGIKNVKEFENNFNQYIGSKNCVALNSGTAALHLALSVASIKNKEVILPSLSFVSTAHAIVMNGGKPVFVDTDPKTLCIDVTKIEEKITSKTKVILPVHFGGMPCNLNKIKSICMNHKLLLIEDAAHAVGTTYKNKRIGTHGFAVCFSFHPVKNLAMPSGGAITLNDRSHLIIEKKLNAKRWCGITNRKGTNYDVLDIGWNYYMNEFSAAIGIIQLKRVNKMNHKRKKNAKRYFQEINIEEKMPFNDDCSYHLYWIRVKNREKFIKNMLGKGIETGVHYKPIHQMTFYKNNKKLPISEKIGKEIVSIPIHPNLADNDVDYIIKTINKLV